MHDETSDPSNPSSVTEAATTASSSGHLVDESSIAAEPKIRIGSQRPPTERPKADRSQSERVKAVAEKHLHEGGASKKTPVPSIRGGLSADLEQELADALEGFSLNSLVEPTGKANQGLEIAAETKVAGRVLKVYHGDVFIDLGGPNQGVLPLTQFREDPQPGQSFDFVVARQNPEDGLYQLRLPGAAMEAGDWTQVAEGGVVQVRITAANKGGLECAVGTLRGFIPAGQISTYRVETFDQFVGESWTCLVQDVNPEARRLILSRRAILEKEKAEAKERLMSELAVGQVREGTVRSILDFGAFVDMDGVDGLLHISRLSWQRVKHPSEVLTVGQRLKVKVTNIDTDTGKIGLSLRDLAGDPWAGITMRYRASDVIRGPVVRILEKIGALVQLEPGVDGMVHISEIAHHRVSRIGDYLKEGQEVEAKITAVDPDAKRISLSIKALMQKLEPVKKEAEAAEEPETPLLPMPPQPKKLKGGVGKKSGGAEFGLKW